jgi:hypothetical protein
MKFWSDSKAIISLLALEIWFVLAIGIYIHIFTGVRIIPTNPFHPVTLIFLALLLSSKWYIFYSKDNLRGIVREIDSLPRNQIKRMKRLVWTVIFLIVVF